MLSPEVLERALDARDPRFDGLFFVGITTTRIYCRPICPARVSYTDRRRFFESAAAAERAGFRPCLRCRPELAPGRAGVDAVSRLAVQAARRIAAGALNGRSVARLAAELSVSERHLRRALERELGVSPLELAQTHRLLLAKQLLADTNLSVTRVAFASGFQSLRRFNAIFRERYRLSPGALRRAAPAKAAPGEATVRLSLGYRPPLDWKLLTRTLMAGPLPGIERLEGDRYQRTVLLDGRSGVIAASPGAAGKHQLRVTVSLSLLDVLMPLLARLRQLFDLDAEPLVVESHLAKTGMEHLVQARPGLRLPGALDGFEAVLRTLFLEADVASEVAGRIVEELGEPADTGLPGLTRYLPGPRRVGEAGAARLESLGLPPPWSILLVTLARQLEEGAMRLVSGTDPETVRSELLRLEGMSDSLAAGIVLRALHWPDAFAANPALIRSAGVSNPLRLHSLAERWRPWRAYAGLYLTLGSEEREQMGMTPPARPRRGNRPGLVVRQRRLGAAG